MNGRAVRIGIAATATAILFVSVGALMGATLFARLTVAGITLGSIYALSGLGLVITYRASGVFNFAHGAIAMFVAYVLWQLERGFGVPLVIAAPLALLVVGPGIGVALAAVVFRPLDRRGAGEVPKLVATVGTFIFLVGLAVAIWGPETRNDPVALFGTRALGLPGGLTASVDQLAILAVTLVVSVGVWAVFEHTAFGLRMRAVVERRDLAEVTAVDANRMSAAAWAAGAGLAGLTGVLLAPSTFGLDPYRFTLLVAETIAVAVVARLTNLWLAVAGGLALGLLASYGTQLDMAAVAAGLGATGAVASRLAEYLSPLLASLPVVVLAVALIARPGLVRADGAGDAEATEAPPRPTASSRLAGIVWTTLVVAALLAAPLVLPGHVERRVLDMLALAIVFVSIVAVTGLGGHISLGHAAFAGLGAFLTGRLVAGSLWLPAMPVPLAMLVAVALCVPLGMLVGLPALRRRGLTFGLTTFAVGLSLERFVFANYQFTRATDIAIYRPTLVGGDLGFHYYAVALLGIAVAAVLALRRGRSGRALTAMRDSTRAARAVGVPVRRWTMLLFVVSTALAALGGSLLSQTAGTFASQRFGTFDSIIWFMAVVVAGATSLHGALVAAFALTVLSGLTGDTGAITLVVGLGALALGRLPDGVVGAVRAAVRGDRPSVARRATDLVPSTVARSLLDRSPLDRTTATSREAAR